MFPATGPITDVCASAPGGWEEYHSYVWDAFNNYENGKIRWMEFSFDVLPPSDILVTVDNMTLVVEKVFFDHLKEGVPLRMCFMNKANRVLGVPVLWHYHAYIEFREGLPEGAANYPGEEGVDFFFIQISAVMGAMGLALAVLIVGYFTLKLINSGVIERIGNSIITPAIMGTALIFVLGIGMVVVLATVVPRLTTRIDMPTGPMVPSISRGAPQRSASRPKLSVGVGSGTGATARRRGGGAR